jgi:hypothetical protein
MIPVVIGITSKPSTGSLLLKIESLVESEFFEDCPLPNKLNHLQYDYP